MSVLKAGGMLVALVVFVALGAASCSEKDDAGPGEEPGPAFTVDGEIALASLMSLSDGHLRKMADSLQLLADSAPGRSGDWANIEAPLSELAKRNVPALNWFALPEGSYWSVQNGKESGNLSVRDYFPKVLAGETVVGELVVSLATGKAVAIVAVPVRGATGTVRGVLGASIYLEQLSELIRKEMGLDDTFIFYSFDESPLVALNWDASLTFLKPLETGNDEVIKAFEYMLSQDRGEVVYKFRDTDRVVLFRKSPATGWWYAFGVTPEGQ